MYKYAARSVLMAKEDASGRRRCAEYVNLSIFAGFLGIATRPLLL